MVVQCQTVSVTTPANITATSLTVTPTSGVAPLTITATVEWTNQGGTGGTFTPNITVNGTPLTPAQFPSETLAPGTTTTHTFAVTNLPAGDQIVCPLPN